MTQQEQLIAKIFDNSVNALGLMAKKIAESIEKEPSEQALRDDFAKAAMHAMLTTPKKLPELSGERMAEMAYIYADIMMQERERRIEG